MVNNIILFYTICYNEKRKITTQPWKTLLGLKWHNQFYSHISRASFHKSMDSWLSDKLPTFNKFLTLLYFFSYVIEVNIKSICGLGTSKYLPNTLNTRYLPPIFGHNCFRATVINKTKSLLKWNLFSSSWDNNKK